MDSPSPSDFRVITTLRYEFRPSADSSTSDTTTNTSNATLQPLCFPSTIDPISALETHLERLQASATAAGWHFPPTTPWALNSISAHAAELTTLIPARIQDEIRDAADISSTQPWRVRLDLSSPADGGELKITIGKTSALPSYASFDPFNPARLPSSEELIAGEADGSLKPAWKVRTDDEVTKRSFHTTWKTSERGVYETARERQNADLGTEVLLQNGDGEIMDGTISSICFWREGRWVTPAATCGPLMSIARDWALKEGLAVEGVVRMDELREREAVWLGNALRGFGWGWLVRTSE